MPDLPIDRLAVDRVTPGAVPDCKVQWVASHWSKLMARSSETTPKAPRSFHPPQQPEWHRMIAEAAYFIAEKRRFVGEHSLDDWLAAEQQVK